ncbi:MAG: hypothetical protein IT384_18765 [Deltaproteobacteria bacterium]|nr:hypothetical protein [Deltaproteobacteria bacterium]
MSSRNAVALAALLTFACAGQPTRPATEPTPSSPSEGAAGPPAAREESPQEKIAAAKAALAAAKAPFEEALAGARDKKVTSEGIDRAREETAKVEKLLADGQPLESKDADYGKQAAEMRAALDKGRAELDARWIEIGVGLQRSALDQAMKEANQSVRAAKQRTATEETVVKAEAALKTVSSLIARGATLEGKDAKYAKYVLGLKPQIEPMEKAIVEARQMLVTRATEENLGKAKKAADSAVTSLRSSDDASAFDAAQTALDALDKALESGRHFEGKDASYTKAAGPIRTWAERAKAEVAAHRTRLEVKNDRAKLDALASALDARGATLRAKATTEAIAAIDQATVDLEQALKASAALGAKEKAHGAYLAVLAKKVAEGRGQMARAKNELAVNAHRAEVAALQAKVAESMKALEGKLEYEKYQGVEALIDQLKGALTAGEPLGAENPKYGGELKALQAGLPAQRMQMRRIWIDAANNQVKARLTALEGKPAPAAFTDAEKAVDALAKTVDSAKGFSTPDKAYLAFVGAAEKQVPVYRTQIEQRRFGVKVEAHRAAVEAKAASAAERMKAIEAEPPAGAFEAADVAVTELERSLAADYELAKSDRANQTYLAEQKKKVDGYRAQIGRRKVEVLVGDHRKKLNVALGAVTERLKALEAGAADPALKAAEEAVSALEEVVKAGGAAGTADAKYAKEIALAQGRVAPSRAEIDRRRTEAAVARHKAKVDAAVAALTERLAKLSKPEAASFDEAEKAAAALEATLAEGDAVAAKDKTHGALLAALKSKLPAQKEGIARGRTAYRVSVHRAEVEAQKAKVTEHLAALAGKLEKAPYQSADQEADELADVVAAGEPIGAIDPKYAQELKARAAEVPALKNLIRRRRVEAAALALKEKLAAAPSAAASSEREQAAAGLERALDEGDALGVKDKALVALIAAERKKLQDARAAIEKQRLAEEVSQHAAELTAAEKAVAERLAAISGKLDDALYSAAEDAVAQLKKTAEKGAALGAKDPAYAKRLAAANGALPAHRVTIRRRRIEAAQANVVERLKALEGKPQDPAFGAAESAVRDMNKAIEAGRALNAEDKGFVQFLAASEKQATDHRARIDRRRVELVVEANKAEVEAAQKTVAERMEALKGKPDAAAFKAAEAAVAALKKAVESGGGAGAKDAAYARVLAATEAKIAEQQAAIARRQLEVEVAAHKEQVAAAVRAVNERLGALAQKTEAAAFTSAEESIGALESALSDGKRLAAKSPGYDKELAAEEKKIAGYRARITARRTEVDLARHLAQLESAQKAMNDQLKALSGAPKAEAFEGAEEAVAAFEKEIAAGSGLAKADARHAKRLAELSKEIPKARAAIAGARLSAAVAAHQKSVEAAAAEADQRVEALKTGPTPAAIKGAEGAIGALEAAIKSGEGLAKQSDKHAKWLAGVSKRIAAQREAVGRRTVETEIKAHREKVAAAEAEVGARLSAVVGKLEYELYQKAEEGVSALEKAISSGDSLAEKDQAYARELTSARGKIDGHRIMIRRRWIEAAEAAVAERIKGLDGKPDEASFKRAEDAVQILDKTIASAKTASKDAAFQKLVLAAEANAKKHRAAIDRRRIEVVVDAHKGQLDAAEKTVAERMEALKGKPDAAAFKDAEAAVDALKKILDAGVEAGQKDPKYAGRLASLQGKIGGYRAAVAARHTQVEMDAHVARVDAALKAMNEQLRGLAGAPKAGAFESAEEAVSDLEKEVADGARFAKADQKHAKRLAELTKEIPKSRAAIAAARLEGELAAHRKSVETSASEAGAKVDALGGGVTAGAVKGAESAVGALEEVVESGQELGKKSDKHAKWLAGYAKRIADLRGAIGRRAVEVEVKAHKEKVAGAEGAVATRLEALAGKLEYELYQKAEEAVSALANVLDGGESLAEKDRAYAKDLGAARSKIDGYRITIRRRWIEAAAAAVAERIKALEAKADEAAFDRAEDAVDVLDKTIASAKTASKDGAYQKLVLAAEANAKKDRAEIARRRVARVVEAHQAELDAALKTVTERLDALKGKAGGAAFEAAEASVTSLKKTLDSGADAAAKDAGYGRRLASLKGKIDEYHATIERRRFDAEVSGHREKVDAAVRTVSERLGALSQKGEAATLSAAEESIGALESVLAEGKPFAGKNAGYAKALAAESKKIGGYRSRVEAKRTEVELAEHRQTVEAAASDAEKRVEGLGGGAITPAAVKAAEEAVGELEAAVKGGPAKKTESHAKLLATYSKRIAGLRETISRRAVETEVKAHREKLTSAETNVGVRLEALAGKLEYELYQKAEEAVSALSKVIDGGESLAEKDRAYAKDLGAARSKIDGYRITIRRRWIEAAAAAVAERIKALEGKADETAFDRAEDAVDVLDKTIASAKTASKEGAYQKLISAAESNAKKNRAEIARRRVAVVVDAHQAELEAALKTVTERLDALKGKPEPAAFEAAEASVTSLKKSLDSGSDAASKDASYGRRLASLKGKIDEYHGVIERRRFEMEVSGHREKVDAAVRAVTERLGALSEKGEAATLGAAEESIGSLESVLQEGKPFAEKNAGYAKALAAESKKIGGYRSRIAAKRTEVELAEHRRTVEAAASDAEKQVEALGGGAITPAAVKAAEEAVGELEAAVSAGPAKKNEKHAKWLAGYPKRVAGLREAISRRSVETEVKAHREKLTGAEASVTARLDALEGKLEYELYQKAEESVSALAKVIEGGEELGEKDKGYAQELARARAKIDGHRITIRRRWIEAAEGAVAERMKALEGRPEEAAFGRAEDAVETLDKTIASAKTASKDKAYQKLISTAEANAKKTRARIDRRRIDVVVDAHKAELEAAETSVTERLDALKGQPEPAAFEAAETAVKALEKTLESGSEAAAKDASYGRRLSSLKAKTPQYQATIGRRRFDVEVRGQREKVAAAVKAVNERIDALGAKSEAADFESADASIQSLESALEEGKPFADRNKDYAKELARDEKKIGGYRSRIVKKRTELDVRRHAAELDVAQAAVSEKLRGLGGSSEASAFEAAEEAVGALEQEIADGARLAKADKKLQMRHAALKKDVPKRRAAIAGARLEVELAQHRKAVDAATREAEQRVEALSGGSTPAAVKAAEAAVEGIDEALKAGSALAKKSDKHGKWVAARAKQARGLRETIDRRAVETDVKAHREELQAAESEVSTRIEALVGKLEYELYQKAEEAVSAFGKVVSAGQELGDRDKSYGKELAGAGRRIEGHRIMIRRRWIEAAESAAAARLGELEGKHGELAFKAAEDAVRVLEKTIESGKTVSKDKVYQRFLADSMKNVRGARALIERRRTEADFGEVLGELDKAVNEASARMGQAESTPEPEVIDAAAESLNALSQAIDANAPVAQRDKEHKKRLAMLRKAVAADRAKLGRLRVVAKGEGGKAKLEEAEEALVRAMKSLDGRPGELELEAAGHAISELESALSDTKAIAAKDKKVKARAAAARKKIVAARAKLKSKQGDVAVSEHRATVEAQLAAAREAMSTLKKGADREALATAEKSVDDLVEAIAAGKALAKKNQKYGRYLAVAKKTSQQYQTSIKKMRTAAEESEGESESGGEGEESARPAEPRENPAAKLDAALMAVRGQLKSLGKRPDEDALSSARTALDDLSGALDEAKPAAKKSKSLAKKIAAGRAQLGKGRKQVARLEAAAARAAAASASASASASEGDPKKKVAEAWAAFSKQLKALKKKKRPSSDDFDSVLSAATDVEQALEDGQGTRAAKSAKYKKYAASIRKKLKAELTKIKKRRRAFESASR